jgi:hypothetical protein
MVMIIAILLATNIGGIAYFLMHNPSSNRGYASSERKNAILGYLKNDIGFSDTQLLQYDTLMKIHKISTSSTFDSLKKEKENGLKYIAKNNFSDTAIRSAVAKTIALQELVEIKMLMHLKEVRLICTDAQRQAFDSTIYKMFARKGSERKKHD